jgi:hypothetical protein
MTDFTNDQPVLELFHEPKPYNPILSKKKKTANDMALRDNKPMVVVSMGHGSYEIYPKSIAEKWEKPWVYESGAET